jgi:hypothetical protein
MTSFLRKTPSAIPPRAITIGVNPLNTIEQFDTVDKDEYCKWHGMSALVEKISEAVNAQHNKSQKHVNGWAVLSVVIGIEEVCRRLTDNLNMVVLVASLLISTALSMAFSPPSNFADQSPNHELWSFEKAAFFFCVSSSVFCYITAIILSLLMIQAINTCARDSDKWRLILRHDSVPTKIYVIFSMGNLSMATGISFGIENVYGGASYGLAGMFFACALWVNVFNRQCLLRDSHVVHGWYNDRFDEDYDIRIPFSSIRALAATDRMYKEQLPV